MASTVLEAFADIATSQNDAIALLTPGKADSTFAELFARNEQMRTRLAQFGVQRGMRIGYVVPTRDAMAMLHFAAITTAVSAPFSALTTPAEFELNIRDFRLSVVILEQGLEELRSIAESQDVIVITLVPDRKKAGFFELEGTVTDASPVIAPPEPGDVAWLLQTSGTTSRPKVVPRSQEPTVQALDWFVGERKPLTTDRFLVALPLHHVQGLEAEFMNPFLLGSSVAIVDFRPETYIQHMENYRPTRATLVPSMHRMVLETVKDRRDIFVDSNLKWIDTSSAALTVKTYLQMKEVYGVPIIEGYGSSEAGNVVVTGVHLTDQPLGSVGKRAHSGVAVMGEDGNELPPNVPGEVCIKSPGNIDAYDDNPEATAAALRNGYYRMGDIGYFDENDYLFILGRLTETISRGGENIAPSVIDDVLLEHPAIRYVAAFGVKHETLGQEVWAAVVPEDGEEIDPVEIRAFAASKLSFASAPKRVVVVDELPHNELGKLVRADLSARYEEAD